MLADGAAALVLVSAERASELGLRVHASTPHYLSGSNKTVFFPNILKRKGAPVIFPNVCREREIPVRSVMRDGLLTWCGEVGKHIADVALTVNVTVNAELFVASGLGLRACAQKLYLQKQHSMEGCLRSTKLRNKTLQKKKRTI